MILVVVIAGLSGCRSTPLPVASDTSTPRPLPSATASNLPPATPTVTLVPTTIPSPTETQAATPPPTPTGRPEPTATRPQTPTTTPSSPLPFLAFGYTYQQPDGNRFVAGQGTLPNTSPLDIRLADKPRWVVAAPGGDGGSVWAVVLADGRTQAFRVTTGGLVEETTIMPAQLAPGMPPLLRIEDELVTLPVAAIAAASLQTHPIVLPAAGQMVSLQAGGQVLVWDQAQADFTALEANALPDARILVDESARLLLLSNPTARYGHGVLGDVIEAAGITLIETQPTPHIALIIPIPDPTVVEGISPIWTDLTGDGVREIIVTLSNAALGAQVVVYNETGEQIAAGPAIGRGSRWRHQLVVAPFGPAGELELVDVLTPHIGGTVEFYRLAGDILSIVAKMPGYTSHVIGTRNLDMAVAADFDGDGRIELLLPNQRRSELGAIRRTSDGAEVAWQLPVDGVVTTNLAAVSVADDRLAVGVGREDGVLRLWGW